MRVLFNESDLRPILIREANQRLSLSITADDIIEFTFETDDEDDVVGVAIEFEAASDTPTPNP